MLPADGDSQGPHPVPEGVGIDPQEFTGTPGSVHLASRQLQGLSDMVGGHFIQREESTTVDGILIRRGWNRPRTAEIRRTGLDLVHGFEALTGWELEDAEEAIDTLLHTGVIRYQEFRRNIYPARKRTLPHKPYKSTSRNFGLVLTMDRILAQIGS